MRRLPYSTDRIILDLAGAQHGVVTRRQLVAAGMSHDMVDRRIRAGLLMSLHRGVYRVGPIGAGRCHEMAAVLACDGKAVISHSTAAALWEVMPQRPASDPIDIIACRSDHGRMPGIHRRRARTLRPDEVTKLDCIPLTTVTRTLLDLAGVLDGRDLERAVAEALVRRLTTLPRLVQMLKNHPGQPGIGRLRALVGSTRPALTRSEAEERFLALVRRGGIQDPEVNVRLSGYEVDFYWRRERFVVEVDGFAFHASKARFELDRTRDAALCASGLRIMRVTWRQITEEPEALLVRLAGALALAARSA